MERSSTLDELCTIYVLKCRDETFYVGRSNAPDNRIVQHFTEKGSVWTRLHPPVEIFRVHHNCLRLDEDKYTKALMAEFGIENVRGGSYCQVTLTSEQFRALEIELRNAYDKCLTCGRSGHFAKDCFARTEVSWQAQNSAGSGIVV